MLRGASRAKRPDAQRSSHRAQVVTPNELEANRDSSGSDNSSAVSPSANSATVRANTRLWLERKRQRELADVDLTSAPDDGSEPAHKTRRRGSGNHGSGLHTAAAASNDDTASKATKQTKKKGGRIYHSRARAEQEVVPLPAPDKPPARRCRRKSDEIYEEWEKTDGRYIMTYRRPKECSNEASDAVNVRGKSLLFISSPPPLHMLLLFMILFGCASL